MYDPRKDRPVTEKPSPKPESKPEVTLKSGALSKDNGVIKKVLVPGQSGVTPKKNDKVLVHYEGRLTDGTVFDSSYERGQPYGLNIGVGRVVKGWDIGVMAMELGEKAELTIESDYGYGDKGRPGKIPGGATMIFTLELLAINEING